MKIILSHWLMLVISLSGRSQTPRMRLWRALKGAGAAMLRDGVYVLPESDTARALFKAQIDEAKQARGSAHMVSFTSADPKQEVELRDAFDRTQAYAQALDRLAALRRELRKLAEAEARKRLTACRRELEALAAIDFFPGAARAQVETALADAEQAFNARFAPDEPHGKKQ